MSVNEFMKKLEKIYQYNEFLLDIIIQINKTEYEMIEKCKNLNSEDFSNKISSFNEFCIKSINQTESRQTKTGNIRKILENKEIQIIFVGAVSCGKSKIINCILQEEVLPSSIGSTTTRTVKLTGTDEPISFIKHGDKPVLKYEMKENLYNDVMNISSNVENDDPQYNDPIIVQISSPACPLLNSNLYLIDTPGYDNNDDLKSVVMETCQTSDIIVFVMTYVFSEEEKEIFKILSEKTSRLNMFILINKWDESDNDESETAEISKNVMEKRMVEWFRDNNEMPIEDAKGRIFFISAQEKLNLLTEPDENMNEFRNNEFDRFIKSLKTNLNDPEYCKCLKHENDINKMETEMESHFNIIANCVDEILKSRNNFITDLNKIRKFIETEKECILKKLNEEREKKLANIEIYIESLKNWLNLKSYFHRNDKTKENELLDLTIIVANFDNILNELEKVVDENLTNIISNLDSTNKKIPLNLSKLEQITKNTNKIEAKKQEKSKSKNESQILLENQMIDMFGDFTMTITIRMDLILDKIKSFLNVITPNEIHLKQKFQELIEFCSKNNIKHLI